MFIQGGSPIPGSIDTILRSGDSIRTHAGATVILELSDGSELILGENTNLNIAELTQDPQTGGRRSTLKLFWGKMRSLISKGHQGEGASYHVQTPNALVGVKFSKPDSEVLYDPNMSTTTVIPHRFDTIVTNLVTNDTVRIPEGFIGIVKGRDIQKVARTIPFDVGSSGLSNIAKLRLHSLAMILREFPEQTIVLEGHADNLGSKKKNLELSQERAETVKTYLIETYGFAPNRIETISCGASVPLESNDTEAGRARNRRVTVSRKL